MPAREHDPKARRVIERVIDHLPIRTPNAQVEITIFAEPIDICWVTRISPGSYEIFISGHQILVMDRASISTWMNELIEIKEIKLRVTDDANGRRDNVIFESFALRSAIPSSRESLVNDFINRRTQTAPAYRIRNYTDPTTLERVRNLRKALFIQENVRNGLIHGLYDPESLYAWSREQGQTTSPMTRRPVTQPFLRLPEYLLRDMKNAGVQTNRATAQIGVQTNRAAANAGTQTSF